MSRVLWRRCAPILVSAVVALTSLAVTGPPAAADGSIDPTMAAQLQGALDSAVQKGAAPGIQMSISLADGSRWDGASGVGEVGPDAWPVMNQTPFVIGSITKTFIAATVLQLAEEGVLGLDDPLSNWMPDYPEASIITLRELLSHTSGVMDYFESPDYEHLVFGRPTHHWTTDEILSLVGPPDFPPGTDWSYSNTNFVLLGLVIEAATGESVGTEIQDRFLTPLGMDDTYFEGADPPPVAGAMGYLRESGGWYGLDDGTNYRPNTSAATVAWSVGNIESTSHDLSIWARALYGGDVLEPDYLAQMVTFNDHDYGLGTEHHTLGGRDTWGHNGSLRGYEARMYYLPVLGATVSILSNRGRWSAGYLAARVADILFRQLYPDTTAPVTTAPTVSLQLGAQVDPGRIPVRVRWSTVETESGVKDFEVRMQTDGGAWQTVPVTKWQVESDMTLLAGHRYAFSARATDVDGNVGDWAVSPVISAQVLQERSPSIVFSSGWATDRQSAALGHHLASTRLAGATASISFDAIAIGWVADTAPHRGTATPIVDGVGGDAVDLQASGYMPRQLVMTRAWDVAGPHTLSISVDDTHGQPRVDLDALILIDDVGPPPGS